MLFPQYLKFGKYHNIRQLAQSVADILSQGSGACVIQEFPVDEDNQHLLQLTEALGKPMYEERNIQQGAVYLIELEESEIPTYANTSHAFPCHTDCSDFENPPDTVILLCERQAKEGGDSYLVSLEKILLHLDPTDIASLSESQFLFREQYFPILSIKNEKSVIRYNRVMLEVARRQRQLSMNTIYELLNRLDSVIQINQTAFRLQPSDCLVLNNHTLLHGRERFSEAGHRRLRRVRLNLYLQQNQLI